MSKTEFKNKDLRSGYVVELRNGVRRIVARVNDFTRILVNPETYDWNYLSAWGDDLKVKDGLRFSHNEYPIYTDGGGYDIVKVYGLLTSTKEYGHCFRANESDPSRLAFRPLLWERKDPVKMTVAEICEKLGYEVEIVAEVQK